MFWNKSKNKIREKQYYNLLVNSIDKLNNGDITYLRTVYCAMAYEDKKLIVNAAKAINKAISNFSSKKMIHLDEQFRSYSSLDWSINWENVKIQSFKTYINNIQELISVLILGSFHPSGFFREACLIELAKYEATLPFLILRMNDWVEEVRTKVNELTIEKILTCNIFEIISALPFLEKIQNSQRKNNFDLLRLQVIISDRIEKDISKITWHNLTIYELSIRKSAYKILFSKKIIELEQVNEYLNSEKDSFCKSLILRGIFKCYDCSIDEIDQYLTNKNSIVRFKALEFKYKKIKNTWSGIENMLLDPKDSIRELVIFILHKHSDINIIDFYIDQLQSKKVNLAIIGIGENGDENYASYILPFLEAENVNTVKNTLQSLGNFAEYDGYDLFWKYLLDTRISVSKAAYSSIRKNKIHYGSNLIYNAIINCNLEHCKRYLILLLLCEDTWERLPYLLEFYNYEDNALKMKIRSEINRRTMYKKISKSLENVIKQKLIDKATILPLELINSIEFDFKYVTKI